MKNTEWNINGVRITGAVQDGRGPTALLVHGNSLGAAFWEPVFRAMPDRSLVAIDLPGHGGSDRTPGQYGMRALGRFISSFAHTLTDYFMVGHSLGGHLALQAKAPGRGLLICGTPPLGTPPAIGEAFSPHPAVGHAFSEHLKPQQLRELLEAMLLPLPLSLLDLAGRAHGRARAEIGASLVDVDFEDEIAILKETAVPVCLVQANSDALVQGRYLEALAGELPTLWRGAVQRVPGPHLAPWSHPRDFAALIESFAADL